MAKNHRERIESELELPENIIQHIQSFLDGKEAAQTSLLSRPWYQAWFSRPNLDFDQEHFSNKPDHDFWKLATNTVERYEKRNIKIDSLRLSIQKKHSQKKHSLVKELITKALKMGATCIDFKIHNQYSEFVFPNQVFGFGNLTRLSRLSVGYGLVVEEDNESLIIRCSRLKYLTLECEIISSCPFLKDFSLSTISDRPFLPEFFEKQHLKSLYLLGVVVPPSFFDDFSCKFPRIKNLALYNCDGYTDIQLSSPSLESLTFGGGRYIIQSVKLDVPNIRIVSFKGSNIPLMSFEKTDTSNWKFCLHIECESIPRDKWFQEVSRHLKKLRSFDSEVILHLNMGSEKPIRRVSWETPRLV